MLLFKRYGGAYYEDGQLNTQKFTVNNCQALLNRTPTTYLHLVGVCSFICPINYKEQFLHVLTQMYWRNGIKICWR